MREFVELTKYRQCFACRLRAVGAPIGRPPTRTPEEKQPGTPIGESHEIRDVRLSERNKQRHAEQAPPSLPKRA